MVSVYLVIGSRFYREALGVALAADGLEVVGEARHPLEAIWEIGSSRPDVVLLDLSRADGQSWVWELRASSPHSTVLGMGLADAASQAAVWAEAGLGGYVGSDASYPELVDAVRSMAGAAPECHPHTAAILLHRPPQDGDGSVSPWLCAGHLTRREREIVRLLGEGLSNQEIAWRCHISLATVKNHVHNVLGKLGVHRRQDAVREIRRIGFLGHREPGGGVRRRSDAPGSVIPLAPRDGNGIRAARLAEGRFHPSQRFAGHPAGQSKDESGDPFRHQVART
jgi:DNA-binding NarL/FixJ family response regulator